MKIVIKNHLVVTDIFIDDSSLTLSCCEIKSSLKNSRPSDLIEVSGTGEDLVSAADDVWKNFLETLESRGRKWQG